MIPPTAGSRGDPGRGRGDLRMLLLLLAPGLLLGVVAVALWAWSAVGGSTSAASATPTPTSSATPTIPGPTPDPTPETPAPPVTPTSPPDLETVDLALNSQYNGESVRIAYYGMGEEDGKQYARLGIGTFQDGVDIRLFADEPYELPDGRWLHLRGFGANESVHLDITLERDSG